MWPVQPGAEPCGNQQRVLGHASGDEAFALIAQALKHAELAGLGQAHVPHQTHEVGMLRDEQLALFCAAYAPVSVIQSRN